MPNGGPSGPDDMTIPIETLPSDAGDPATNGMLPSTTQSKQKLSLKQYKTENPDADGKIPAIYKVKAEGYKDVQVIQWWIDESPVNGNDDTLKVSLPAGKHIIAAKIAFTDINGQRQHTVVKGSAKVKIKMEGDAVFTTETTT